MNDSLFSEIILCSATVVGYPLYAVLAVLLKRWLRSTSLKGFKIRLGLLNRPLRFLITTLCVMEVLPSYRLPEKMDCKFREVSPCGMREGP
jgi:hypothetical protein